jgi:CBS domain-containing protein
MSSPVITATPETSVKELARLMTAHRISGIPVISAAGELVGIVTEADLLYKEVEPKPAEPPGVVQHLPLRSITEAAEHERKAEASRASEIMTFPVTTVLESASVHEIAELMVKHRVNRVPVVRAGRVVGIVSRNDVLKAFTRPDDEPVEAIQESLLHDLWIDVTRLTIQAKDGIVYLEGHLERRSEKELTEKWAAMADGAVGIQSRLTYELDDDDISAERPRRWPGQPPPRG